MTRQRIFLAHAREDKLPVRKLYADLKVRGFDPWLDEQDLRAGQIWKTEIPKGIREAKLFLACLSGRSVGKVGFVQNEFREALVAYGERPAGSIYLVPVRLEDCEVPDLEIPGRGLSLRDFHWIDLWQDDGFDRLVSDLEHALGLASRAPSVDARRTEREPLLGEAFRDIDAPWCPEMVVVPAGSLMMGSPIDEVGRDGDEGPLHEVRFASAFAMGRHPVTFEQYDRFAGATDRELPPDRGWGRGHRPVFNVSWDDAKAYVKWLRKQTNQAYRLPSEAEWEYACRAGTRTRYSWGDDPPTPEQANFGMNLRRTTEVGSYPPNPWGLYDMHGNLWEWCEDCWNPSYEGAPDDSGAWTSGDCSRRVLRGGSWSSDPEVLRSADRGGDVPVNCSDIAGFRVARTLTP
jgi:formylglycine-generating enzyme required for sulfatase activity